tara:strand:- start:2023 stop:2202 length:180 start_codon:yes stop_codon:yes gene_type:complete
MSALADGAKPIIRQPVDVRRLNLASITPDVGVTHVIDEDENDVGPIFISSANDDGTKNA